MAAIGQSARLTFKHLSIDYSSPDEKIYQGLKQADSREKYETIFIWKIFSQGKILVQIPHCELFGHWQEINKINQGVLDSKFYLVFKQITLQRTTALNVGRHCGRVFELSLSSAAPFK